MTTDALLSGVLRLPDEPGYAEDCKSAVWNGAIDRRPAAIVHATSAEQVVAALAYAKRLGLDVTVRGGGHSFAGHAIADGAVMIDLSRMDTVTVDPAARTARVGGGASLAALDAATAPHGLATPGGTISHTGVGGLTLGGGFGWLTRWLGLSCDNLVDAEVVTADGRIVRAADHPDLMWALKGGGGNFGVVTEFVFRLHEVNPMANLGLFFWTLDAAREPLRFARDWVHTLPRETGMMIAGMSAPPAPFVPPEFHGAPGYAVLAADWGPPEAHAAMVAPLRALAPTFELVTPMPYVALQQMLDAAAPWGAPAYEKALYMTDLPDEVVDIGIDFIGQRSSPMSMTPIFPLGGAFAEVGDDDTAFGGRRRDVRWAYNIAAIAPGGEVGDLGWVADLHAALGPYATDGTYVNFLADAGEERVRAAYGDTKYARLAAIKREWDPGNVFRHNANIRPS